MKQEKKFRLMTNDEKLQKLIDRIPSEEIEGVEEKLLLSLLENAKYIIFNERFPYDDFPNDVEPKYEYLQISIALELFNKIGIEGEVSHSENGISRTYNSGDVSDELIDRIIPMAGVL